MAALRKEDVYVTPEDYLAAERLSESRHEYLAGVIYAMAGASRAHNRITSNIVRELGNALRGKSCEAFSSDMKLRITREAATFYYYPDVVVDCSGSTKDAVEEPSVIFEVLSPETERTDRGEKLRNYQSLPSLTTYALIDQFRPTVTVYQRTPEGWVCDFYGSLDDILPLPALSLDLPLSLIYDRMGF